MPDKIYLNGIFAGGSGSGIILIWYSMFSDWAEYVTIINVVLLILAVLLLYNGYNFLSDRIRAQREAEKEVLQQEARETFIRERMKEPEPEVIKIERKPEAVEDVFGAFDAVEVIQAGSKIEF